MERTHHIVGAFVEFEYVVSWFEVELGNDCPPVLLKTHYLLLVHKCLNTHAVCCVL